MPPRLRFDANERADLHLHTHHSDGLHSPEALVAMAVDAGLAAIAITDHATTAGVIPACQAGARRGLHVLPGVELNSSEGDLLGLWIDVHDPELQRFLVQLRAQRTARSRDTVERLTTLGMPLDWETIQRQAAPAAPMRSHIASALVAAGHCIDVDQVFDRWLGHGRPAWLPGEAPSLKTCCLAIQQAGGVAVEAHPLFHVARSGQDPAERCARLAELGVCGLEALPAPEPSLEGAALGLALAARRHDLLAMGGSDFHGAGLTRAQLAQHTVGGHTLRALQDRLPAHSIHRDAIKRVAWRAAHLEAAELAASFEPTTVVLERLHRRDLLSLQPPPERPDPYPLGRPFVLLGPGALAHRAQIQAQLHAEGAQRLSTVEGTDYPTTAWTLYEMFGGCRPRDARDLTRFELDRHLWGEAAERCCLIYYDPPSGQDSEDLKALLRRGIGQMRFYRVVFDLLRDTCFTSFLHMPDPQDVDRECWHLRRLGLADPLGP